MKLSEAYFSMDHLRLPQTLNFIARLRLDFGGHFSVGKGQRRQTDSSRELPGSYEAAHREMKENCIF
jgi:hypothetical protein